MEAQYLAWHSSSTLAGTPSPWGKSQPLSEASQSPDLPEGPKFWTEQGLRALWGKKT